MTTEPYILAADPAMVRDLGRRMAEAIAPELRADFLTGFEEADWIARYGAQEPRRAIGEGWKGSRPTETESAHTIEETAGRLRGLSRLGLAHRAEQLGRRLP